MSAIRFRVSTPRPAEHLLHVEVTVHGVGDDTTVDFCLPVWTPGSYLVREYSQHVQRFTARSDDGSKRAVRKVNKTTWQVDCRDTNSVELSYDVFAHDVGVRNNHVDFRHAFITPSATFVYPLGRLEEPVELTVAAPDGWEVFCPLPLAPGPTPLYVADDFDHLYDAPIETGPHASFEFQALGVPHKVVWSGQGNFDQERLARDLPKIVEANAKLFGGGLPYTNYLTLVRLTHDTFGGLEHRNSTALMFPRNGFVAGDGSLDAPVTDKGYRSFLSLFAHEHFHTWHVKRIRPRRLGPFDYTGENYTRDLWTIEGITSYYEEITLLRAGLTDGHGFLKRLADAIKALDGVPGRAVQSLEDSSFDAWIKLYRPHENNRNSTVSYYLKGMIVAALLDVFLRSETRGEKSLDHVMKELWRAHSQAQGYPEGGLETIIEEVSGIEIWSFFDDFVRGTSDPDYNDYFESVGLELTRSHKESAQPWIGADLKEEAGRLVVTGLRSDAPGYEALDVGDQIVAVDGIQVGLKSLAARLRDVGIGNIATLHVFRDGLLTETKVEVGTSPPDVYKITRRVALSDEVKSVLEGWIGALEPSDEVANES